MGIYGHGDMVCIYIYIRSLSIYLSIYLFIYLSIYLSISQQYERVCLKMGYTTEAAIHQRV